MVNSVPLLKVGQKSVRLSSVPLLTTWCPKCTKLHRFAPFQHLTVGSTPDPPPNWEGLSPSPDSSHRRAPTVPLFQRLRGRWYTQYTYGFITCSKVQHSLNQRYRLSLAASTSSNQLWENFPTQLSLSVLTVIHCDNSQNCNFVIHCKILI